MIEEINIWPTENIPLSKYAIYLYFQKAYSFSIHGRKQPIKSHNFERDGSSFVVL